MKSEQRSTGRSVQLSRPGRLLCSRQPRQRCKLRWGNRSGRAVGDVHLGRRGRKIPNARYCAVASRSKTVTLPGNTLIESRGSAAGEFVTVMVPVAVITLAGVEPEAGL